MFLIFDVSLRGFAKRYSKYLKMLGYRILIAPDSLKHDHILAEYARRHNAIIVTTDKFFPYERKIILPMSKPKYETWYTLLLKSLSKTRIPHRPMSKRYPEPVGGSLVCNPKVNTRGNKHEACAGGR